MLESYYINNNPQNFYRCWKSSSEQTKRGLVSDIDILFYTAEVFAASTDVRVRNLFDEAIALAPEKVAYKFYTNNFYGKRLLRSMVLEDRFDGVEKLFTTCPEVLQEQFLTEPTNILEFAKTFNSPPMLNTINRLINRLVQRDIFRDHGDGSVFSAHSAKERLPEFLGGDVKHELPGSGMQKPTPV